MSILSSIENGLSGAVSGFLTGGPAGAAIGGVTGAITNSGVTGSVTAANASGQMNASTYTAAEQNLQNQQLASGYQLDYQAAMFDEATANRAETQRETNQLRNVAMEEMKANNKLTDELFWKRQRAYDRFCNPCKKWWSINIATRTAWKRRARRGFSAPQTEERNHMGSSSFRVADKIFA